jgi:hypothetical protein
VKIGGSERFEKELGNWLEGKLQGKFFGWREDLKEFLVEVALEENLLIFSHWFDFPLPYPT